MLIITNRGFVTTSGAGSNSDVSSFNTGGTGRILFGGVVSLGGVNEGER